MKKFHKKNTVVGPHQTASAERGKSIKIARFHHLKRDRKQRQVALKMSDLLRQTLHPAAANFRQPFLWQRCRQLPYEKGHSTIHINFDDFGSISMILDQFGRV